MTLPECAALPVAPSPLIRPATQADASAIADLIGQLAAYVFETSPHPLQAALFGPEAIAACLADPQVQYWVLTQAGTVQGAAALKETGAASGDSPSTGLHLHVHHLFVAPGLHRQGLARQLWLTLRRAALGRLRRLPLSQRPQPALTVNSSCYAVPVYERFGFQCQGPVQHRRGLCFQAMTLDFSPTELEG